MDGKITSVLSDGSLRFTRHYCKSVDPSLSIACNAHHTYCVQCKSFAVCHVCRVFRGDNRSKRCQASSHDEGKEIELIMQC